MNRLKVVFFENGITLIAQSKFGKTTVSKLTSTAQSLVDKSREAEFQYSAGILSASALLRLAANHYDDDKVITVLNDLTNVDKNVNSDVCEPPSPEEQRLENDMSINDRDWILTQDPDLTDIGIHTLSWETSNWTTEDDHASQNNPDQPMTTYTVGRDNVNDAVEVLCTICNMNKNEQHVINCGHFFCPKCIDNIENQSRKSTPRKAPECALCRSPIASRRPIILGSITLAWKQDVENEFGSKKTPDNNTANNTDVNAHAAHLAQLLETAGPEDERYLRGEGKNNNSTSKNLTKTTFLISSSPSTDMRLSMITILSLVYKLT